MGMLPLICVSNQVTSIDPTPKDSSSPADLQITVTPFRVSTQPFSARGCAAVSHYKTTIVKLPIPLDYLFARGVKTRFISVFILPVNIIPIIL